MARIGLFDFEYINPFDSEVGKGLFDPDFSQSGASAVLTGTFVPTVTEADVVAGGKTTVITLTGDTWIAAGALSFDVQRQAIIDGHLSAQSELLGWNLVPRALQGVAGVVRTSDTVVTVTWSAFATYDITATETITVTVPAAALTAGVAIVAAPTFGVTAIGAAGDLSAAWVNLGIGMTMFRAGRAA